MAGCLLAGPTNAGQRDVFLESLVMLFKNTPAYKKRDTLYHAQIFNCQFHLIQRTYDLRDALLSGLQWLMFGSEFNQSLDN